MAGSGDLSDDARLGLIIGLSVGGGLLVVGGGVAAWWWMRKRKGTLSEAKVASDGPLATDVEK